ncbi:MAG: DNA translocase FtsK 4TM domain-containing protein, partial [Ilumatobacteraceae bacterium]
MASRPSASRSRRSDSSPARPGSGARSGSGSRSGSGARSKAGSRASSSRTRPVDDQDDDSFDPAPALPGYGGRGAGRGELRRSVEGREDEFIGVGLIAGGVVAALAIYLELAGPVGRGLKSMFGWLIGAGRWVLPLVLVAAGVTLIRSGRSVARRRATVGWSASAVGLLGMMHLLNGPGEVFGTTDELGNAGGFTGSLLAEPLSDLLAVWGAVVVLMLLVVAGAMLATGSSVRTFAGNVVAGLRSAVVPVRRAAERLSELGGNDEPAAVTTVGVVVEPHQEILDIPLDDDAPPARPPRQRKAKPVAVDDSFDPAEPVQSGQWSLPPLSYLQKSPAQTINTAEVESRGRTLVEALASHGVETRLLGQTVGPTVTRYELELGSGIKVARITSLNRDIAYAMAATDVRILAPIPGRSAIGVEVPNHTRQLVSLGDIMTSAEARQANNPLDVAVGKDIAGRSVFLNLATTPHLLIAGATGAGKSSGINCIITSILMRTTPDTVKLILIDPKQVEMGQYNKLPHLLTAPVTNPKKAANALGWAVKEMERRYDLLFEVGFRDILGYNAAFDRGELQRDGRGEQLVESEEAPTYERLPYIVVVVDELNDLMMVAARDVEESITRIAQKARAVG